MADWKTRIEDFLAERLLLQLNPARERLRPVSDGVNFLGYIVRPHQLLVCRRVVGYWHETLRRFESRLVKNGTSLSTYRFDDDALQALQASLRATLRAGCSFPDSR